MDQDDKNNKGIDLSGALKDSGTGVKFEEYRAPRSYYPGTPKIIQWVIKYSGGLVKSEKQASYVLIGFVAVVVIISLFLFLEVYPHKNTTDELTHPIIPNTSGIPNYAP